MAPDAHSLGEEHRQKEGQQQQEQARTHITALRTVIKDFAPSWFVVVMDTGILGIIMARLPYRFTGLSQLTDIMYILDIVLFIIFSVTMLLRFILFRGATLQTMSGNIEQLSFLAAAPAVAWLTIAALTATQASNSEWGGHAFVLVAYIMWWIGAFWATCACVGINIAFLRKGTTQGLILPTSFFLTMVSVATAATTGGTICNYGFDVSARLAVPVIIVSYFLVGLAIFLAFCGYGVFTMGLLTNGWPAPKKLPSLFLLVGPLGQSSAALQLLGTAALGKRDFANYAKGTFLQGSAASGLDAASTLVAILLMGFEYYLAILAFYALAEAAYRSKLTYTLTWWSTIYPLATLDMSWLLLGTKLESPAFDILTTALFLILILDYFVNFGFTIYGCVWGTLLLDPSTEEMERGQE